MTSTNSDDVSVIEFTDVYIDTNLSGPRAAAELNIAPPDPSGKATSRSSLWSNVADNAPHFLDSKKKLFFRLALPFLLVSAIQIYLQWDACRAAAEKLESTSSEDVPYAGDGLCIDLVAEMLNTSFYLAVLLLGYLIRKELILSAPRIFKFVEQMSSDDVERLQIKNKKEWGNVLTGRHDHYRPWNIRGHVILPMSTSLLAFLFFLVRGYFRKYGNDEHRACAQGAYGCGPDNYWAISDVLEILLAVRYAVSGFFVAHAIMTGIYPLVLISLIVGPSVQSRIGLWNQGDVSLSEVQRISMHASLYLSGAAFLLISYTFRYTSPGLAIQILCILFLLINLLAVLFVPTVPAILALRLKKEEILAAVFKHEERANIFFLGLLEVDIENRLMKPLEVERAEAELARIVKYRIQVQDASVVPSSLELIKTYTSSVFLGIVLPLLLSNFR